MSHLITSSSSIEKTGTRAWLKGQYPCSLFSAAPAFSSSIATSGTGPSKAFCLLRERLRLLLLLRLRLRRRLRLLLRRLLRLRRRLLLLRRLRLFFRLRLLFLA
mmetsp:Transcript_11858/g.34604  ORF Transcript_11858/g.34604 Transcript_11858/m.34604 type:complete len:104 (+) Transcript_11858:173-484(+)